MAMKPKQLNLDDDLIGLLDFIISYKGKDASYWLREGARRSLEATKKEIIAEQLAMQRIGHNRIEGSSPG